MEPAQPEAPAQFDERIAMVLRDTLNELLAAYPMVRGISCAVDYYGRLNDADVNKAVWITRKGPDGKMPADALAGALMQTLRLADLQFERLRESCVTWRAHLQAILGEVADTTKDKRNTSADSKEGGG